MYVFPKREEVDIVGSEIDEMSEIDERSETDERFEVDEISEIYER